MELTREDYQRLLLQLLPEGPIWPRDLDTVIAKVLGALSDSLVRVDRRAADVMGEIDPRQTRELLVDWERNFGLPDGCMSDTPTGDERRLRLHQKVAWQGGQSKAFFIGLLEALGYPGCTITEYRRMTVNSKCDAAINQGGWCYAWRVNVPLTVNVKVMTCNSSCDAPLARWGDPGLMCVLSQHKPAHTILYISYGV
ncbi:uncharacterized protein YmfQ (DUF2313 family) [Paucimonas lemoignei]|uniref:Uncharacterized protein YmfQ (DUF2313 family) n=1 Tax=Paucimonas lemoignei TaxID=29443 RepID=A0A4R3HZ26_PAULE|nr:putative phage tail protein [Paucimonas lemoignei]TCS37495.1 uncharacterized protein YmfQ (DUF2313 family) [Paucimonas lemoignei]